MKLQFCLLKFAILVFPVFAAGIKEIEISHGSLGVGQVESRGPHLVKWDEKHPGDFLLLTLGGTNSIPRDMDAIAKTAVQVGFSTIGLDYNNSIISTTCSTSKNLVCFENFRKAVTQGKSGSDLLQVSPENSMENRLRLILNYLVSKDRNWEKFFNKDRQEVVWNKIVIIGHSQGSGHAAYLAKKHPLKAVIMLAGPQDRFSTSNHVASWISEKSETPKTAYFSLLHKNDFFNSDWQIEAVATLRGEFKKMNIRSVEFEPPKASGYSVLVSNAKVRDAHMSVITPEFKEIWKYLLTEAIELN